MRVVHAKPPNFDRLQKEFGITDKGVVFTYGDTLYVPDGRPVDDFLMAHEETHSEQQGKNPEAWYERYFADPYFRANQELAAYQAQYRAFTRVSTNREANMKFATSLARDASSSMYGNCVSFSDALRWIRS